LQGERKPMHVKLQTLAFHLTKPHCHHIHYTDKEI